MADAISISLSWFANYTNFYSVVSVLICFSIMVIFILRLNGDHFLPTTSTHYRVVKEQPMDKLTNPLSVHLSGEKHSSLKDGIYIQLSMLMEANVAAFWGVNIQEFQRELRKASSDIGERLLSGKIFDEQYLHNVHCGTITESESSMEVFIKPSAFITEDVLGDPPRMMYPMVIVSALLDTEISLDYTAIVLQFTVLHLKDSVCSLDSHIVYQFLKTNHSQVLSLQPIFLSTTDNPDSSASGSRQPVGTSAKSCKLGAKSNDADSLIYSNSTDNLTPNSNESCSNRVSVCDQINYRDISSSANSTQSSSSLPRGDTDTQDCDDIDASNMCVVCQSSPIFYTLLTCRHACVCQACIGQLDRCPMCRSYIDAYFRLSDRPGNGDTESGSEVRRPSRWEVFNRWFNARLGFN